MSGDPFFKNAEGCARWPLFLWNYSAPFSPGQSRGKAKHQDSLAGPFPRGGYGELSEVLTPRSSAPHSIRGASKK